MRLTIAPGITAPEESVTVPDSVPAFPADWAQRPEKFENKNTNATKTTRLMDECIHYPLKVLEPDCRTASMREKSRRGVVV